MDKISLSYKNSSAEVLLRGGLVNRLVISGREILFPLCKIVTNKGVKKRGGIPILFPNADPITKPSKLFNLKQHGFARDKKWQVEKRIKDSCILSLTADNQTLKQYPFNFRLFLKVKIKNNTLEYRLQIINLESQKTLPVSPGLHPYFRLPIKSRKDFKVNLPGLSLEKFDWNSVLSFPYQKTLKMFFPDGKTIKMEASSHFKYWLIWGQKELDFICLEPWAGKRNSLLKEKERLNILPGQAIELSMMISLL